MHLPSAIRLVGAAIFVLASILCRPAAAFTVAPDAKSVDITGVDVGKSFAVDWSKEIGNCRRLADLTATSTWNVLGLSANKLTLSISMTNTTANAWWGLFKAAITSFGVGVSPNATGAYAVNGDGDVFDAPDMDSVRSSRSRAVSADRCLLLLRRRLPWRQFLEPPADRCQRHADGGLPGDFSGGLVTLGLFP